MSEDLDGLRMRCAVLQQALALTTEAITSPSQRMRLQLASEARTIVQTAIDKKLPKGTLSVIRQAERAVANRDWRTPMGHIMMDMAAETPLPRHEGRSTTFGTDHCCQASCP